MRMVFARGRAARIALAIAGAIVAVLGLAQLLLPGIAAQRMRDQLARYGDVHSATVRAFPRRFELLRGHMQAATLSAGSLSMSLGQGRGAEQPRRHAGSKSQICARRRCGSASSRCTTRSPASVARSSTSKGA